MNSKQLPEGNGTLASHKYVAKLRRRRNATNTLDSGEAGR